MTSAPVSVLFVCLGNICRSPTAEAVFRAQLERAGLAASVCVDSCGTAGYHIGEPPDGRACEAAARRGYDLSTLRGRQFEPTDFQRFDYILAMDRSNLAGLEALRPNAHRGHLGLFLDFAANGDVDEVPDPYYGGDAGFEHVLDLIEAAGAGLLRDIERVLRP